MDFDSDIPEMKRFNSTREAYRVAINDMREEKEKFGENLYEILIRTNPKSIKNYLPNIEVIPLNTTYYGEMPVPLQVQREKAIRMLEYEIELLIEKLGHPLHECRLTYREIESIKNKKIKTHNYLCDLLKNN